MKITKRQYLLFSLILIGIVTLFYLTYLYASSNGNDQASFEYEVQQGDTCLDIAHRLGVSIVSIVEMNNLKPDCSDIYPGLELRIAFPSPTPFGTFETLFVTIDCERVIYIIREGDSISKIADDYSIPKRVIRDYNGLEDDILTPGIGIVIPLCVRTPRYIDPTPKATIVKP